MLRVPRRSTVFPRDNGFIGYTFPISISAFLSRRSGKCPRRDTTKRVLQTKGFQVTETSRSSCHLNELRTALKMKRRDGDMVERAKGRLEEEQEGKPLDVEATRQPEYGRKRMRERGKTVCHPTDGGPENRETIQSAADAANCPLIIRTRAGVGGERKDRGGGPGCTTPVFLVFVG